MRDGEVFTLEYVADNGFPAACEVQVYRLPEQTVVVVTDIDSGPSVTNNAEKIASTLAQKGIAFGTYYEHYAEPDETFDIVEFAWKMYKGADGSLFRVAVDCEWYPSTRQQLEYLIGAQYRY